MSWLLVARKPYGEQGCGGGHQESQKKIFDYGAISVFQGDLSPLSSRAVVESCVMPVLLYGCENWVLIEQLISRLETFQGELAKTIFKLSSGPPTR